MSTTDTAVDPGLGWDGLLVTGGSADPLYRRAIKSSMGASLEFPWRRMTGEAELEALRGAGFRLVAAGSGKIMAAGKLGKIKTFTQMIAVILLILLAPTTLKKTIETLETKLEIYKSYEANNKELTEKLEASKLALEKLWPIKLVNRLAASRTTAKAGTSSLSRSVPAASCCRNSTVLAASCSSVSASISASSAPIACTAGR